MGATFSLGIFVVVLFQVWKPGVFMTPTACINGCEALSVKAMLYILWDKEASIIFSLFYIFLSIQERYLWPLDELKSCIYVIFLLNGQDSLFI